MNNPSLDAGIPVLTEVIPPPRHSEPAPLPAQPVALAVAQENEDVVADVVVLQQHAVEEWDDARWDRLEREIRERVLHEVLERIDFVLEQRVRDSLADVLQNAVEGLAADIKSGLHNTVKEVITRAVAQEITRLQSASR